MDGIKMKGEEKRKNQSKGESGGNGVWGVSLGTLSSYRTVVAELKTEFEPFVNKAEKTERRKLCGLVFSSGDRYNIFQHQPRGNFLWNVPIFSKASSISI